MKAHLKKKKKDFAGNIDLALLLHPPKLISFTQIEPGDFFFVAVGG